MTFFSTLMVFLDHIMYGVSHKIRKSLFPMLCYYVSLRRLQDELYLLYIMLSENRLITRFLNE